MAKLLELGAWESGEMVRRYAPFAPEHCGRRETNWLHFRMHRRKAKRGNPFTGPVIVGRFVYRSHAADHEDKGMLAVIEVLH